jgi:hypothetical protein
VDITSIIWLIFPLCTIQPLLQQRILLSGRTQAIHRLEKRRRVETPSKGHS